MMEPASLFPLDETPGDEAPPVATEPATVVARQTYPCAGPCHGSYVFDRAGTFCYRCKRNGHDVAPLDPTSTTRREAPTT